MTETEQARILSRVKKMLNLAGDAAATEGERDNAMRMAHATLAKYNLDIAQAETDDRREDASEPRVNHAGEFNGYPWARSVCHSVAELFFCSYVVGKGRSAGTARHYFIGRQSNAVTAALLAEFLVRSVAREAGQRQRAIGEDYPWAHSFMRGAAGRIRERVRETLAASGGQRAEAPRVPGTALVLASLYQTEKQANALAVRAFFPKLKKLRSNSRSALREEARRQGREFGGRVSLSPQVR